MKEIDLMKELVDEFIDNYKKTIERIKIEQIEKERIDTIIISIYDSAVNYNIWIEDFNRNQGRMIANHDQRLKKIAQVIEEHYDKYEKIVEEVKKYFIYDQLFIVDNGEIYKF